MSTQAPKRIRLRPLVPEIRTSQRAARIGEDKTRVYLYLVYGQVSMSTKRVRSPIGYVDLTHAAIMCGRWEEIERDFYRIVMDDLIEEKIVELDNGEDSDPGYVLTSKGRAATGMTDAELGARDERSLEDAYW